MFLAWGKGLQLDDFSEIPSSPTFSLILYLSFHDSNIRNSEAIPERGVYRGIGIFMHNMVGF